MKLRTFQAESMAAALKQVKRELGTSAVILHTRTFKQGGFLGFGRRQVVEITASDDVNVAPPPGRRQRAERREAPEPTFGHLLQRTYHTDTPVPSERAATVRERSDQPQPTHRAASPETQHAAPAESPTSAAPAAPAASPVPSGPATAPASDPRSTVPVAIDATIGADAGGYAARGAGAHTAAPEPVAAHAAPVTAASDAQPQPAPVVKGDPQLASEVRQIRSMVDYMIRRESRERRPELPDALFTQYLDLLEQEVAEELAEEVIHNVRHALPGDRIQDTHAVREAIGAEVASLLPVDTATPFNERPKDGRPFTLALIGPTGVGKTTTVAKLAATLKLREKKKVALVTIDTYRIAAVDQLQTYADIIKVPLHVVMSPDELGDALANCADCDVVLIDTAGRSQRDDEKLDQLRRFVDVANPHEVHLVLSSTCAQRVLMEAVERFTRLRVDRIIFTKLDEAVNFGVLLNVVRRVNKRLSYVTTGQEVPHDIERSSSARLAKLILGERVDKP